MAHSYLLGEDCISSQTWVITGCPFFWWASYKHYSLKIPAKIQCMCRFHSLVPRPRPAFQHSGHEFSVHAPTKPQEHIFLCVFFCVFLLNYWGWLLRRFSEVVEVVTEEEKEDADSDSNSLSMKLLPAAVMQKLWQALMRTMHSCSNWL